MTKLEDLYDSYFPEELLDDEMLKEVTSKIEEVAARTAMPTLPGKSGGPSKA